MPLDSEVWKIHALQMQFTKQIYVIHPKFIEPVPTTHPAMHEVKQCT